MFLYVCLYFLIFVCLYVCMFVCLYLGMVLAVPIWQKDKQAPFGWKTNEEYLRLEHKGFEHMVDCTDVQSCIEGSLSTL